ncbi:hypothetical protein [Sphingobacterium spiritivorum]
MSAAGLFPSFVAGKVMTGDNWQRDNIYYDLTPTSDKGKFITHYREFIHYISISESGYNLMTNTNSDPDDPTLTPIAQSVSKFWSDGYFEIRFDVLSNSKSGEGEVITDIISVKPQDLFDIEYESAVWIYRVKKITPKFAKVDIPLQAWDLENVTYGWKISVSELDQQSTTTINTTLTSKFATNFGIDNSLGGKVKLGLKFGASAEVGSSKSHTIAIQNTSDQLGDVLVYFGDKISLGQSGLNFVFNTPYNSNISMLIAPKRIY